MSDVSPENLKALKGQASKTLKDVGFSDADLQSVWSHPMFRDHRAQALITKAVAYDLLVQREAAGRAELSTKRGFAPAPHTFKPGVSEGSVRAVPAMPEEFSDPKAAARFMMAARRGR